MVIGEATKKLSGDFRDSNPEISWKSIAGMRDKLIHKYDEVDLNEVWDTINIDLPRLISFLENLPRKEKDSE